MLKKDCPCCGQALPTDIPDGLNLKGKKREIFDRVHRSGKRGIMADVLFDVIYSDYADGGPMSGAKVISAYVWRLNKKIKPFGLRVMGEHSGHGVYSTYRLVNLNA